MGRTFGLQPHYQRSKRRIELLRSRSSWSCPRRWRARMSRSLMLVRKSDYSVGKTSKDLLRPGSEPKTCMIYIPQRVHLIVSVGNNESANIPVNAGISENIINKTKRLLLVLCAVEISRSLTSKIRLLERCDTDGQKPDNAYAVVRGGAFQERFEWCEAK